jgi:hypothetical protein
MAICLDGLFAVAGRGVYLVVRLLASSVAQTEDRPPKFAFPTRILVF